MDKTGYEAALRYLLSRDLDVYVIQILSAAEIDPDITGDLRLIDCEDADVAEVSVTPALMTRYKQTLATFIDNARQFCTKRGMVYLLARNEVPVEDLVGGYLRNRGLVTVESVLPELSNMLSWWQWAILAAVPPAIVLLYFLKLKRRPLEVPSTYLWHKSVEDLHVNSIWQRLRNNLLLYLQLAVVLFIVLALLRPSWQALRLSGSRLVLLIDNSASMQATDVKPSRLEEAKRRVGELIDQMHSGDSAMLISFSDTARVEQNFTDNRQQLREALAAIRPSQHSTNLSEALKLAAGLVNPGQANENSTDLRVAGTKLFIFSDGRFPPVQNFELGNLEPTFVPIGRSDAANVGIVAFGVSRAEDKNGKLQAFARLNNSGPAAAEVLLKLFVNDQVRATDADRLSIPPGETRGLAFPLETSIRAFCTSRPKRATNWPWTTRPGPSSTRPAGPGSC